MTDPAYWTRAAVPYTGGRTAEDPLTPVVPEGVTDWRYVALDGDRMIIEYLSAATKAALATEAEHGHP